MKALDSRKQKSFAVVQEGIQAGENAELRLDIPAYKDHGVWVNSIHQIRPSPLRTLLFHR
jgi:hypothetical protein